MDSGTQSGVMDLVSGLLDLSATPGERIAISDSASSSTCTTMATLISSDMFAGNATGANAAINEDDDDGGGAGRRLWARLWSHGTRILMGGASNGTQSSNHSSASSSASSGGVPSVDKNASEALSKNFKLLGSGMLVGRFAGMPPAEASCQGLLVSASKLDAAAADGSEVKAGNSSFTLPANFSGMANLSVGVGGDIFVGTVSLTCPDCLLI